MFTPQIKRSNVPQTPAHVILQKNNVGVFLIQRPLPKNRKSCVFYLDDTKIRMREDQQKTYNFTKIFNPRKKTNYNEVYGNTLRTSSYDFIHNRKNSLLFAYGATGSGKTKVINEILPKGVREITKYMYQMNNSTLEIDTGSILFLKISFFEIYKNKIFDLLSESSDGNQNNIILQEDSDERTFFQGLSEFPIEISSTLSNGDGEAYKDIINKFNDGITKRKVFETKLNVHSSRSHSIFTIKLFGRSLKDRKERFLCEMSIVDLAGAERHQDDISRQNEANIINQDLLTLSRVIRSIRKKNRNINSKVRIPFRDSNLTRSFKNYFSNTNSSTITIISTIYPLEGNVGVTQNVLDFSNIAVDMIPMSKLVTRRKKNDGNKGGGRYRMDELPVIVRHFYRKEIESVKYEKDEKLRKIMIKNAKDYDEMVREMDKDNEEERRRRRGIFNKYVMFANKEKMKIISEKENEKNIIVKKHKSEMDEQMKIVEERDCEIEEKNKIIEKREKDIHKKNEMLENSKKLLVEKENHYNGIINMKEKMIRDNEVMYNEKEMKYKSEMDIIIGKNEYNMKIIEEKEKIIEEKDDFIIEKEKIIEEKDEFIIEKDKIIEKIGMEKEQIVKKNEEILGEKEKITMMIAEKEKIIHEKDECIVEKDEIIERKNGIIEQIKIEKEKIFSNNEDLLSKNEELLNKHNELLLQKKEEYEREYKKLRDEYENEKRNLLNEKNENVSSFNDEKDEIIKKYKRREKEIEKEYEKEKNEMIFSHNNERNKMQNQIDIEKKRIETSNNKLFQKEVMLKDLGKKIKMISSEKEMYLNEVKLLRDGNDVLKERIEKKNDENISISEKYEKINGEYDNINMKYKKLLSEIEQNKSELEIAHEKNFTSDMPSQTPFPKFRYIAEEEEKNDDKEEEDVFDIDEKIKNSLRYSVGLKQVFHKAITPTKTPRRKPVKRYVVPFESKRNSDAFNNINENIVSPIVVRKKVGKKYGTKKKKRKFKKMPVREKSGDKKKRYNLRTRGDNKSKKRNREESEMSDSDSDEENLQPLRKKRKLRL